LVASLIEAGCRYFVCGGDDPLAWEEAADEAFVMMTLNASEAEVDERMVMTTAHEVESEEKVALFFVSCTNFSAHTFTDFLVLTIGSDRGAEGRLCSAVRAIVSART
jgi:predicted regulator of amino acid metabolism with ACT domain